MGAPMFVIMITFADFSDLPIQSRTNDLSSCLCAQTCSTSYPSSNQVGGLPLVVNSVLLSEVAISMNVNVNQDVPEQLGTLILQIRWGCEHLLPC